MRGNEATYTVKLVDKDGNVVTPTKDTTVTVVYKDKTTNDGLDTNKSRWREDYSSNKS